jgi:hypothetical protein
MSHIIIPRRTFLRGLGTALALPMLDAMVPTSALAQSVKGARPLRMAFMFVPNGVHMADWTPKTEGAAFELPHTLQPFKKLQKKMMVLTGLTQDKARPYNDGGGDHARSASVWLTGVHPLKTAGADISVGISADQLAAQKVGWKSAVSGERRQVTATPVIAARIRLRFHGVRQQRLLLKKLTRVRCSSDCSRMATRTRAKKAVLAATAITKAFWTL